MLRFSDQSLAENSVQQLSVRGFGYCGLCDELDRSIPRIQAQNGTGRKPRISCGDTSSPK